MANLSRQSNLSRLDRVFTLLENGASAVTRKAAAKQLGDVQSKHPHELNNLLAKILYYIHQNEWDTRIAAAEAMEAVVSQVPVWKPEPPAEKQEPLLEYSSQLTFRKFDIDRVLSGSQLLLASSGDEYHVPVDTEGLNTKDRIKKQRKVLEKRLGLTFGDTSLGVTSDDLFQDEDLVMATPVKKVKQEVKQEIDQNNAAWMPQFDPNMSSRERNLAKRKAKLLLKQQSRDGHSQEGKSCDGQPSKKRKRETREKCDKKEMLPDDIPKHSPVMQDWTEWPFNWICDEMINMLFSPSWESRHGACLGLREIVKKQGSGSGKQRGMQRQELLDANQSWLTDLSIRLLCVISLDRFADFVSDQVVAPVRESCAQTLSVVTSFMKEENVMEVVHVLLHLYTKEEWELRQSAMLALQYVIAVRKDLQHKLLPICFPSVIRGLDDKDGDVRSVSAKTLMPTTDLLTKDPNYEQHLQVLLKVLWNSLHDYDELTSSTQSVLLLLAKLIKALPLNKICQANRPEVLVSFLWPFFHHVIANVREAALSTLLSMLAGPQHQTFPWLSSVCVNGLWNLFQSCLLEPKANLRDLALEAFLLLIERSPTNSILPCTFRISSWLALSCQPALVPYNPSQLIPSSVVPKDKDDGNTNEKVIAGRQTNTHCEEEFEEYLMKTRELSAKMIGVLCNNAFRNLPDDAFIRQDSSIHQINHQLLLYMKSQSATQRIMAALVIGYWWENLKTLPSCSSTELHCALSNLQNDSLYFNEVSVKFVQVQTDLKCLLMTLQKMQINCEAFAKKQMFMFGEVIEFCTTFFPKVVPESCKGLYEQRDSLLKLAAQSDAMQSMLDSRVKSSAACAIVSAVYSTGNKHELWKLPEKLNPVIRPLMECIKKETNATVRSSASFALSRLIGLCCDRQPCPNGKLIKNLCLSLCSSNVRAPTPRSLQEEFSDDAMKASSLSRDHLAQDGIITQLRRCQASMAEINRKKRKAERKDQHNEPDTSSGAENCLQTICDMYGTKLFHIVPQLWEIVSALQDTSVTGSVDPETDGSWTRVSQSIVTLEVMAPPVRDPIMQEQILSLLPQVMSLLWTKLAHIRFLSARCLARFAEHMTSQVMPVVLEKIRSNLDSSKDVYVRKGAIETVANIVDIMGTSVVTYAVLLVVPLLGCMSDCDPQVRLLATHCFAQLIQFMPVESSIPDPPNMPDSFVQQKIRERRFLEQLFDSQSLEAYQIPVQINATLRSYQEDGVKWLAFLNRYKLHGVLCDEMGLGKTLQTICMVASDHHYKAEMHMKQNSAEELNLYSLVVCPPTLTGHWLDEVKKFCENLSPLQYAGNPMERNRLQREVKNHNLVIASYEVVRNDITFFNQFKWNYCVLDEGHAIRNGKSKTSQAIKSLVSNHRLILTGTPIQNSVLELWSLFDFLIPGFLGSEQEFNVRFTKPIVASRDAKSSSKEQEQGVLAMESLHRQVLPFMMRRMKEDVLKDLPPKIIQDYYCDLSPLQLELYEDFAKSRAKKNAESSITNVGDEKDQKSRMKGASHVFQALQYLQKVCNHPLLVVTPTHPHYKSIMNKLTSLKSTLRDIRHATKLTALKQLLLDCGIGVTSESLQEQAVVSQHRALVFCQHRNLLDIIEKDLFSAIMPTVTYLRLDGGVAANRRFSLVTRFNNDPSIDVLLLTTKVGGLGLNLTGADTVIFVEHDWNPMVDLQAMDRAHRIGQKKVVNVYRLITRGTLEEKILGLQKFKLSVANTVVGEDNRGLQSMGTSQVLELFTVDKKSHGKLADGSSSKGLRAMMEDLGDLWDQSQYDDEYNIDSFIQTLDDKG